MAISNGFNTRTSSKAPTPGSLDHPKSNTALAVMHRCRAVATGFISRLKTFVRSFAFVMIAFQSCYPSAVNADLITELSKLPTFFDVALSPDGKKMATIVQREGRFGVLVQETDKLEVLAWLAPTRFEAAGVYWGNNERIIINIGRRNSYQAQLSAYGEIYAINYDGTKGDFIYGIRSADSRKGSRTRNREGQLAWGRVIDTLPNDPKHILIASEAMSSDRSEIPRIVRLNVKNGRSKELLRAPVQLARYLTDEQGEVRLAFGTDLDYHNRAYYKTPENRQWIEIDQFEIDSTFQPLTIVGDNLRFLARLGDKRGYHRLNLGSGELKTIYEHTTVDVSGALYSSNYNDVLALRIDPGYTSYLITKKDHPETKVFKSLLDQFPGLKIQQASSSVDGNTKVFVLWSDTYSGFYYLWKDGEMKFLFKSRPDLDHEELVPSEPIKITTRDGMIVNGYLTKASEGPGPTVMLIHGGPHGIRDYWTFDSEVQMLATQGINVIRVNFRGSGGYGQYFLEKGYRQWGAEIQHDIIDTTLWAIEKGITIKDQICIMGSSFGAYSAVQSATMRPDLYQCVVASAGVYDLPMLYSRGDVKDVYSGEAFLEEVLGTNKTQLAKFSPVNHIHKLKADLLLVHGVADQRAPVQHARKLMKAMDQAGIQYEASIEESEGHGLLSPENRLDYYHRVSKFIKRHITPTGDT